MEQQTSESRVTAKTQAAAARYAQTIPDHTKFRVGFCSGVDWADEHPDIKKCIATLVKMGYTVEAPGTKKTQSPSIEETRDRVINNACGILKEALMQFVDEDSANNFSDEFRKRIMEKEETK